ncbi:MAG: hypothetical protein ABIS67_01325 [Candidatus Eisenbacteria bacterium]
MNRFAPGALAALALIPGILGSAARVDAAATVHRFSFEIGAGATQIAANNYNKQNEFLNRNFIEPRGLEGFDRLTFSFLYDAGIRFFVRPNVALRAGVGQMRAQSKREYLPAIGQDIQIRTEILSVPMHLGADYYFTPYNQGDFQARAFMGGGLLNTVQNRVLFQTFEVATNPGTTLFGSGVTKIERDSPGWYGEAGVHMFFAMRYSVLLNGYYRSAKTRGLVYTNTNEPYLNSTDGQPFELDLSGIGGRLGFCIGF